LIGEGEPSRDGDEIVEMSLDELDQLRGDYDRRNLEGLFCQGHLVDEFPDLSRLRFPMARIRDIKDDSVEEVEDKPAQGQEYNHNSIEDFDHSMSTRREMVHGYPLTVVYRNGERYRRGSAKCFAYLHGYSDPLYPVFSEIEAYSAYLQQRKGLEDNPAQGREYNYDGPLPELGPEWGWKWRDLYGYRLKLVFYKDEPVLDHSDKSILVYVRKPMGHSASSVENVGNIPLDVMPTENYWWVRDEPHARYAYESMVR